MWVLSQKEVGSKSNSVIYKLHDFGYIPSPFYLNLFPYWFEINEIVAQLFKKNLGQLNFYLEFFLPSFCHPPEVFRKRSMSLGPRLSKMLLQLCLHNLISRHCHLPSSTTMPSISGVPLDFHSTKMILIPQNTL